MQPTTYEAPHWGQSPAAITPHPDDFAGMFSPRGRLGRMKYFVRTALVGLLYIPPMLLVVLGLSTDPQSELLVLSGMALALLVTVFGTYFSICQNAKRCHDIGESGWFQLITLVPFGVLFLLLSRGQEHPNRFGNPPM